MNKPYAVEIPVAPEMAERFKAGCEYYGMSYKKDPRSDYWTVELYKLEDLFWLGANLFGDIPTGPLLKRPF